MTPYEELFAIAKIPPAISETWKASQTRREGTVAKADSGSDGRTSLA